MKIREGSKYDALAMEQIAKDSGYAVPELELDEESIKEMFDQKHVFFVAEDEGEDIGYVALDPRPSEKIELVSVEVKKAHQHKGIGKALVETALGKVWELDKKELFLFCHPRNKTAIEFYSELGFKNRGLVPGHYSTGEPALLLSKKVD